MAVEQRRKCGFRKVGGVYLVSDALSVSCDRLPFPLHVCPTCGQGIKQARGWTWINPVQLFGGRHGNHCLCAALTCPTCNPMLFGEYSIAGLLWIGSRFYRTPEDYLSEATSMGVSKRIKAVPRGFKIGKTWVLLAHLKGAWIEDEESKAGGLKEAPGIFSVFQPKRVEVIVLKSEFDKWNTNPASAPEIESCYQRGLSCVPVPDDDRDHNPIKVDPRSLLDDGDDE